MWCNKKTNKSNINKYNTTREFGDWLLIPQQTQSHLLNVCWNSRILGTFLLCEWQSGSLQWYYWMICSSRTDFDGWTHWQEDKTRTNERMCVEEGLEGALEPPDYSLVWRRTYSQTNGNPTALTVTSREQGSDWGCRREDQPPTETDTAVT